MAVPTYAFLYEQVDYERNAVANSKDLRLDIHDLGMAPSHSASTMAQALSI